MRVFSELRKDWHHPKISNPLIRFIIILLADRLWAIFLNFASVHDSVCQVKQEFRMFFLAFFFLSCGVSVRHLRCGVSKVHSWSHPGSVPASPGEFSWGVQAVLASCHQPTNKRNSQRFNAAFGRDPERKSHHCRAQHESSSDDKRADEGQKTNSKYNAEMLAC